MTDYHEDEAFFWSSKIVFQLPQFWIFFSKLSWIGPWVSRIDWCKGHWCGSTYIVVRLTDICSKTGKKWIFCVLGQFFSLCRSASQPYWLSHINALRINWDTNPIHEIFEKKYWELAGLKNSNFLNQPFWNFLASFLWKSVNMYNVAKMGRNFDDYLGLQRKSKCA